MHRLNVAAVAAAIIFGFVGGCAMPVSERSGTVYEGAFPAEGARVWWGQKKPE